MHDPSGGTPVTQTFSSPEGRFRIGLPGKEGVYEGDEKTFKWFILNEGQFQIFYVDREGAVDTPDISPTILNNFRALVSSHGKLTAESEISFSGHPGHEFRTESDNGGTQIDRIYLAGNRIYVVTVFVPKSLGCKVGSAVKVLDTFEITE
jgi:hypothetical protein